MADDIEFEEEEFTTQFNGQTSLRILAQIRPHWKWVVGLPGDDSLVAGVGCVFHLPEQADHRSGHHAAGNGSPGAHSASIYAVMIVVQAVVVFTFIYLAGVLGERVQLRPAQEDVQSPAGPVAVVLQQDARRLDHVARDLRLGAHRRPGDVGHAGRDGGHRQHRHGVCCSC